MRATVILADVKGSRRRVGRAAWGARLEAALDLINERHQDSILGRFEVEKGVDEFGGILRADGDTGTVLVDLWVSLHPVPIRFALVEGSLDVAPRSESGKIPSVRRFDGPALHKAADALDDLRRSGLLVEILTSKRSSPLLAALANTIYAGLLGWTPRQLEVYRAYQGTRSQTGAAALLEISQPAVSEALSSTHARLFDHAITQFQAGMRRGDAK